jgi:hypothetical protein
MFSVEKRDRVRDGILEIARANTRIVSGAMSTVAAWLRQL